MPIRKPKTLTVDVQCHVCAVVYRLTVLQSAKPYELMAEIAGKQREHGCPDGMFGYGVPGLFGPLTKSATEVIR